MQKAIEFANTAKLDGDNYERFKILLNEIIDNVGSREYAEGVAIGATDALNHVYAAVRDAAGNVGVELETPPSF